MDERTTLAKAADEYVGNCIELKRTFEALNNADLDDVQRQLAIDNYIDAADIFDKFRTDFLKLHSKTSG